MNIKTKIAGVVMLAALIVPGISLAQTPSVADLQAQIQVLLAEVQSLQAQLTASGGGGAGTAGAGCYTFTNNLSIGMSGVAVTALQNALQKDGESVTVSGTFDDQTAAAVTGFQEKYQSQILAPYGLSNGTGYVGKSTRMELNALFGCGTGTTTPTPTPVCTGTCAPFISSLSPSSGPIGTQVTITGTNFGGTSSVLMNGVSIATNVTSSQTSLTFTVPNHFGLPCTGEACPGLIPVAPGVGYAITVQSYGQTSNAATFTVSAPTSTCTGTCAPFISSLSPSSGVAGTKVTITGTNFGGTSSVFMNNLPVAANVASSPTSLTFTVPSTLGAACTTGSCPLTQLVAGQIYAVTVQSYGKTSNAATFSVFPPSPVCTGSCNNNSGGVLTASISPSNPQSAYVSMGLTGVVLAGYQFTADTNGAETLTQMNIIDSSSVAPVTATTDHSTFINYRLTDSTGNILATGSENTSGTVQFNFSGVNVPVNAGEVVYLTADVNNYPYATSGATHAFALSSFNYYNGVAANTVNVSNNIIGNLFTVYRTTLNAAAASFPNPTSISTLSTVVGEFSFTAGYSSSNPVVKSITLSTTGSVLQSNTTQVLGLYDASAPSTLLATSSETGTGNAVFTMTGNNWTLSFDSTRTLLVKVYSAPTNLAPTASGNYQVLLSGVTWSDGTTATIGSLGPTVAMPIAGQNITGLSTGVPFGPMCTGTCPGVPGGTVTVSLDSGTPAATTVHSFQQNVAFAKIDLAAASGNAIIQSVTVVSNSAAATSSFSGIEVYNGSTLVGTASGLAPLSSGPGGSATITLSSPIVIQSGQPVVLTISGDVGAGASGTLDLGIGGMTGSYAGTTLNSPIYGNTMIVGPTLVGDISATNLQALLTQLENLLKSL